MRISDWSSDVCSSDLVRRERPGDREVRRGSGFDADGIAGARKGEQRLDRVISVGPAMPNVECEIDLGRRAFDDHRAALSCAPLPPSILPASLLASSPSADLKSVV